MLLAAGGGGTYAGRKLLARRADRREREEQLVAVRRLADEDVTVFGEQVQRLGEMVAGAELDYETRNDYQVALDAYEHAKHHAPRLEEVAQISGLVDTLAAGRYAMACVHARVAGEEVPEHRVPCFFNPQHGPSTCTVMWTSSRTGTRTVPACQRCAEQQRAHENPEVWMVTVGSRVVPYWEAGATFHPYSRGYFPEGVAASAALAWMFHTPGPGHHSSGGSEQVAGVNGYDSDVGGAFHVGNQDMGPF